MNVKLEQPVGPSAAECCPPSAGVDGSLDAERYAMAAKALAEPIRVRVIDVLRRAGEPVCQCELISLFDVPQPTLSHHLGKLARAGLVDVDRRHRWVYYSVNPDAWEEFAAWLS